MTFNGYISSGLELCAELPHSISLLMVVLLLLAHHRSAERKR